MIAFSLDTGRVTGEESPNPPGITRWANSSSGCYLPSPNPRLELHVAELQSRDGPLDPLLKKVVPAMSRNLEPASESEKSESYPARVRQQWRRRRSKMGRERGGASEETEGLPALMTKPPLARNPDRKELNRGGREAWKSFSGRIRPKITVCPSRPPVASRAEMRRIKATAAAWSRSEAGKKRWVGELGPLRYLKNVRRMSF